MCGIVAYSGPKDASKILLEGLVALEYRGYDSAGLVTTHSGIFKAVGPVAELKKKVPESVGGSTGIAHTRWATHGVPSELNAHPHEDCGKTIALVHNGIIENYQELKSALQKAGHTFSSETDTEVIAHLYESYKTAGKTPKDAFLATLRELEGTYGIALIDRAHPDVVLVACMGSPIVIGIGDGEHFIASDPSAIVRHTKKVLYLNDGEVAIVTPRECQVMTLGAKKISRAPETIEWEVEEAKKGGHAHFMLKEIMEGPEVLRTSARGRLRPEEGDVKLGGLLSITHELKRIKRITIVGCGSAYYAGLVGKYMLEEYAGIATDIDVGSEFRYRGLPLEEGAAVLAVSQSGETADTLASIREAKRRGLLTLGIVNVVGSTIARETDAGVYNHAGPEIGVASTKAFLSQLEVLALLTIFLGRQRHLSDTEAKRIAKELASIPEKVEKILKNVEPIKRAAERLKGATNALYIGRKYNMPIALEGALKLKEVSYVHAEGYGAGEMKHGPIAMIEPSFPTVAIAPRDSVYAKMISNIEEIKARKGPVIAVATEGDTEIAKKADEVIHIPETHEMLTPILSVVPLQLLAYYVGVAKGYNVDRPRNLAKSVTVE